jgi:hypothetical protein
MVHISNQTIWCSSEERNHANTPHANRDIWERPSKINLQKDTKSNIDGCVWSGSTFAEVEAAWFPGKAEAATMKKKRISMVCWIVLVLRKIRADCRLFLQIRPLQRGDGKFVWQYQQARGFNGGSKAGTWIPSLLANIYLNTCIRRKITNKFALK